MDRTKYGRRLTFLNAYFSLAITLTPLLGILAYLCSIQTLNSFWAVWLLTILLRGSLEHTRQILALRVGIHVEDKRGWKIPSGSLAFRKAMLSIVGIFTAMVGTLITILILYSTPTVRAGFRNDLCIPEMLFCVLGIWALLWIGRAAWEWRVNQGIVLESECVELVEDTVTMLPHTEAGMRRYISDLNWLVRLGPWVSTLLLFFPIFFLTDLSLKTVLGGAVLNLLEIGAMYQYWKRACLDRDACQRELEERLALSAPILTTVVTEQRPLVQPQRRY